MTDPPSTAKNSLADFIVAPDVSTLNFGVALFPQFELLDVCGPLEALNMLTRQGNDVLALHLLARTLTPVSCGPIAPDTTATRFCTPQTFQPTHTFATCPPLDVLLVPGGLGALGPLPAGQPADTDDVAQFIRERFPELKYLITVCTGAGLAANAGVLDGRRATSNKRSWGKVTRLGAKTHWVAKARWCVDGKVWTTSGVSAGIDGVVAWIAEVFGEEAADRACHGMEHERRRDPDGDPFCEVNGCEDVLPRK